MSYDLYVDCPQGDEATQVRLLVTYQDAEKAIKEYLPLAHGIFDKRSRQLTRGQFNTLIDRELQRLTKLEVYPAKAPPMGALPPGSWFLQFTFILVKPWMSKDDDPFYVAEGVNPVRKDKVFKVPMMSAASWKGLLRWTAMHIRLALKKDKLMPKDFAEERFVQTLLFGDEKGEEPGQPKDFASFLDGLLPDEKAKEARTEYERLLRRHYRLKENDQLPHHSGRLMFYPTFFDLIDVEVINPHKRETKAGTHPIYLECVPAGAKGTFSLLYVPFDLIGREEGEIRKQAAGDLQLVAAAVKEMMLTYGFSAKRTSGYGVAKESVENGVLQVRAEEVTPPQPLAAVPQASSQQLPKYLAAPGRLKDEYLNPDGTFRERDQTEVNAMTKTQRQEYEKAKKWWEREDQTRAEGPPAEPKPEAAPPAPQWFKREFSTFDELVSRVGEAQKALLEQKGDAQ